MNKPANDETENRRRPALAPVPQLARPEDLGVSSLPAQWEIDIIAWLTHIGLDRHQAVFIANEITTDVLPLLTEEDVRALNLPIGARRKLMTALAALAQDAPVAPPDAHWPPAERRQITVLFCDLVGSVGRTFDLDLDDHKALIENYIEACIPAVKRYEGHIAQVLGDGVMVYFGWPNAHEDSALRSVHAALDMLRDIQAIDVSPPLSVRIGIATGTVVVDGSQSSTHPALGQAPNLAARLQGLAAADQIVIAESTQRLIGSAFELSDLGSHELKGIPQPERAWRVLSVRRQLGRFEAAHGKEGLTPLIAREEEMDILLRRWQQVGNGRGRVELIVGEAGIGKSRLTRAFRERIAAIGERHITLRYQCSPYHVNSSLYPLVEQIAFAAGLNNADSDEQKLAKLEASILGGEAEVKEAAPLMAALLGLPLERYPPIRLDPARLREKTLMVLMRQVELMARDASVLIIFEDVHWIDPTTEAALDAFIARVRTLAAMVVITYRPEYAPRWMDQPHVHLLHLGRLTQPEVLSMVGQVACKPLPDDLLNRIAAHTDGVPLFIEELTKSLLESGALIDAGERYEIRDPAMQLVIPATLRDSLLARLERMAPVKRMVQTGACIGREFSLDLLSAVMGVTPVSIEHSLRQMCDAGLLYRSGPVDAPVYSFKHALVQDAAYESLLNGHRQHLHEQIARVLETDFPRRAQAQPELLAHHYTRACLIERAVPMWRDAGQLALRKVALREAVAHFQRGLQLLDQLRASPARNDLELSLREPLNAAWTGLRGWAAREVADNACVILDLARQQGRAPLMRLGLWAIWVNTVTKGEVANSLEWARRLLDEGARTQDLDLEIFGHGASMISHFCLGNLLEAREHGNRILALYDPALASRWMQITGHDLKTLVGVWAGQWTWMLGYPDQAVRICDERDAHARQLGHAFNLGFSLSLGAYVFDYRCEPGQLLQRVAEADRMEQEHSVPFVSQVMVRQVEGLACLRAGQYGRAIPLLRGALDYWKKLGGNSRVPFLKSALAEALALSAQQEEALALIDECIEQIHKPGWQERSHYAEVLRLKGWMLLRTGNFTAAQEQLRASLDWARTQQAKSWELRTATTLAELLIQCNRPEEARAELEPVLAWFTEGAATRDHQRARQLLDSLR